MKPSPASARGVRRSSGFTLIELLTVIAIIGILAAIIIPTVGKVRSSAQKSRCVSNLRQLSMGMLLFADDNKGRLPYTDYSTTPATHWFAQVRNYVGKIGDPNNVSTGGATPLFQCASDTAKIQNQADNRGGYLVVSYLHMLPVNLALREGGNLTNSYTKISAVAEPNRHPMLMDARDTGATDYRGNTKITRLATTQGGQDLGFLHEGGANVAYYDASVKFIQNPTWTKMRGLPDSP